MLTAAECNWIQSLIERVHGQRHEPRVLALIDTLFDAEMRLEEAKEVRRAS